MKVTFKYSKSLGTNKASDFKEMHSSTAAVLERKGFGKITEKVISIKKTANGLDIKRGPLTDSDRKALELDSSLVKG